MISEEKMFTTMKSKYDKSIVTAGMCVESFKDYETGSDERACLVDLACKITIHLWKEGKYDPMTIDQLIKLIDAIQKEK